MTFALTASLRMLSIWLVDEFNADTGSRRVHTIDLDAASHPLHSAVAVEFTLVVNVLRQ